MTWLRKIIARFSSPSETKPELHDPTFDYRVYWTEQAMAWSHERRERLLARIQELGERADFVPSHSDRRYHLEGLDEELHSGASLSALETVLHAMNNQI